MRTFTITVVGEEVDFEPIKATDIHDAARQTRKLLAQRSVWASGIEPFTATVFIKSTDGNSTVKMPVECAVPKCVDCGKTDRSDLTEYRIDEWLCSDCVESRCN